MCYKGTAQTAKFRAKGIISGLVDIPRMCLLCVSFGGEMYGLGAITHEKDKFKRLLPSVFC